MYTLVMSNSVLSITMLLVSSSRCGSFFDVVDSGLRVKLTELWMKNNNNDLVSSCFEYVTNNANSILGNKLAYFKENTGYNMTSNLNKAVKQIERVCSEW